MIFLKYNDVIKMPRDLAYYFGIFERSYVLPDSCKVSYPGIHCSRIYDGGGGSFPPLPDYLTSKKPRLVRVKSFNAWLGQRHATKMSRRRPSVLDGEILSLHCTLKYSHNKSSV